MTSFRFQHTRGAVLWVQAETPEEALREAATLFGRLPVIQYQRGECRLTFFSTDPPTYWVVEQVVFNTQGEITERFSA